MENQAIRFILGKVRNKKYNEPTHVIPRPQNTSILYSDLINEWFYYHKYKIMESTAYNYQKSIPYVQEYFSGIWINDITTEMIYDYINFLKHGTLSESSIKIYYKIVQLSFKYALMYQYIDFNPAAEIVLRNPPRVEITPFSESEFKLLITAPGPEWVRNGIVIAFRTGMRPGEIYALKWSDINLEYRFISVQRSISRASSHTALKTTKTPTGVRRIDIDSKLVSLFTDLRKNTPGEYVFPGPNGGCRIPWNIAAEVRSMCQRVGIPPRNFYALRHTHASVLMSHGLHPKIAQERLGHHSCQITMDTYSHVCPTMQKQAVDIMENI